MQREGTRGSPLQDPARAGDGVSGSRLLDAAACSTAESRPTSAASPRPGPVQRGPGQDPWDIPEGREGKAGSPRSLPLSFPLSPAGRAQRGPPGARLPLARGAGAPSRAGRPRPGPGRAPPAPSSCRCPPCVRRRLRGRGRLGGRRGAGSPAPPVAARPPRPAALINPRQLRLRPSRRSTSGTARPAGEPPGSPPGSAHRGAEALILSLCSRCILGAPRPGSVRLKSTEKQLSCPSIHPCIPPTHHHCLHHTLAGTPRAAPSPGPHPQASIFPTNPRQTATAAVLKS